MKQSKKILAIAYIIGEGMVDTARVSSGNTTNSEESEDDK